MIMMPGMMQCFKSCEYGSSIEVISFVRRPMIAVGGSASPRGQIMLIPASAMIGLSPIVLKSRTSGTPRTGAAPHMRTASETGRTKEKERITMVTGSVTIVMAINPRTPVKVMI